jgi:DNA-binding transcriptional regulator YdaS (Cro superfamily)
MYTTHTKRTVRVTLDIECYDDLNLRDIDWHELLKLEPAEEVHSSIREFDPFE